MHPTIFHFTLPKWLHSTPVNIYSYAFFVTLGVLISALYIKNAAKKELDISISNNFYYLTFIAGFAGGKLLFYLEHPIQYFNNPGLLITNFNGGYVYYGAFIGCLIMAVGYFKKRDIPVFHILDILVFAPIITDGLGRVGCFFAGCCYGSPTTTFVGLVFPASDNIAVHPTQLYEVVLMTLLFIFLLQVTKRKKFNGQIFFLFMGVYAIGRGGLELFRGDERGFKYAGILSQAQFIGVLLSIASIIFYYKLKQQSSTLKPAK
ncbi:MAG: prolipoprotein diacylglyceryl transferase family protein [Ferruginibacter sp.]